MKFEAVAPESEFEHIRDGWAKAALKQFDPFCSLPEWQLAFHEAFSPKRRLLVKYAFGSMLCFAEKVFSPSDIYLTPIEPHWFFGNPLLGEHSVDLLVKAMEFITVEYCPQFPKILISGVEPKGLLQQQLLSAFGKDFRINLFFTSLQCAASLAGGVDGFLSRRSANFRSKLKKACKRASAVGVNFERVIPTSQEEASIIYSRMLSVEKMSPQGIFNDLPIPKFYAAVNRRLSRQADARIIMARHGGKDIGFISGGMANSIYRGLQSSYDDEWKTYSIGNILHFEQIKWLCEESADRYDMGEIKPHMRYKEHWTEMRIPSLCLRLEKK